MVVSSRKPWQDRRCPLFCNQWFHYSSQSRTRWLECSLLVAAVLSSVSCLLAQHRRRLRLPSVRWSLLGSSARGDNGLARQSDDAPGFSQSPECMGRFLDVTARACHLRCLLAALCGAAVFSLG